MKLDDPVDQRSRSGCAKQFVAQGPEVAAGIVAQQLVELLPHALDARPEFAANRLRVFSGRAGANKVGDVQPNAGRGGVEKRKQIGRASGRERVCTYGLMSVVAV